MKIIHILRNYRNRNVSYYEKEVEPKVLYALEEEYTKSFLNQIKNGVLE